MRAALLVFGGWLLVTGAVFSLSSGVIHTYYTVALAPAIAALVGMGGAMLWQNRSRVLARVVGAVSILVTAGWAFALLERTPDYLPWLRPLILGVGIVAAAALVVAPAVPRLTRSLTGAAVGLALVAGLSGPVAYSATTVTTAHTGSIPSAGPAVSGGTIGGGGPGGTGIGFPAAGGGGTTAGGRLAGPGGTRPSGARNGLPPGASPSATGAARSATGAARSATGAARSVTGHGGAAGSPPPEGFSAAGRVGGGVGPGGGGTTTSAALVSALRSDAAEYRWVAATFGSQSAATVELATGDPVMAIGGFNGEGGNISLATFEAYVDRGDIHYFIASGTGGGGGPGGNANSDAAITSWVEAHFTARTIGGQTVYDLTSRR
jgi:4-amino-4-deoxy-L-arabinose transferase-like glycosyltransferase